MGHSSNEKTAANEKDYPHIVEVAVDSDPLELDLSRRIMLFHKSRRIDPRHGRIITKNNQIYYRWCFFDLATALDFIEQFGGALLERQRL